MKIIALCCIGIEDVLEKEIKELTGTDKKITKKKGTCIFESNKKEAIKFAYMTQSSERVGLFLSQGTTNKTPDFIDLKDINLNFIKEEFSVECSIINTTQETKNYKSNDVVIDASGKIGKKTGKNPTYKKASSNIFIQIIDKEYYIFCSFTRKELSKRDYKVFVNKSSLRATIAYAIYRIGIKNKEKTMLDCFSRSGEICIEAAHHLNNKSINFYAKDKFNFLCIDETPDLSSYDSEENNSTSNTKIYSTDSSMPNIKAAEKNAKIAGLNKKITFSRTSVEDLDLKFNNKIDCIITQLPAIGKETEKKVISSYRQLFEISDKILSSKAKICCIGLNIKEKAIEIALHNNYKPIETRIIMQGKEKLDTILFAKI